MNTQLALTSLLIDLEAQLRELNLWEQQRPTAQALASTQPFAVDTLNFTQWLQFVFIERMRFVLERNLELPTACQIEPMAQEYFKALNYADGDLLNSLSAIDRLLNQSK